MAMDYGAGIAVTPPALKAAVKKMYGAPPAQRDATYQQLIMMYPTHLIQQADAEVKREAAMQAMQQPLQQAQGMGINTNPNTTVMQDRGVATLPTRDDMFTAAGGGIVAFNGEDNDQEVQEAPVDERLSRRMGFKRPIPSPEEKERMTGEFAKAMLVDAPLMASGAGVGRALFRAPTSATRVAGSIPITRAAWIPGRTAGPLYPYTAAAEQAAMYSGIGGLGALGTSEMIGAGQRREQAQEQQKQLQDEYAKLTGAVYPGEATGVPAGIQTVLGGKATPGLGGKATPGAGRVASAAPITGADEFTQRDKELAAKEATLEAEFRAAAGNRPKVLTPEEAQEEARKERETALKKAGIKTYEDRVNALKEEAKTLDRDRDTDRWLALAQGFFAMGAAKSPYALQNMSEGLGVTTSQLRDAEKEYRKGMQAKKAMEIALEDAERKEVLGDVSAGREKRKEALRLQERFDDSQMRMQERLLERTSAERARLLTAKGQKETRDIQLAQVAASKDLALAQREEATRSQNQIRFTDMVARAAEKLMTKPEYMSDAPKAFRDARKMIAETNPALAKTVGVSMETEPSAPPAGWGSATVVKGR